MKKYKYLKTERALLDMLGVKEYSKRKYFFEEYTEQIKVCPFNRNIKKREGATG